MRRSTRGRSCQPVANGHVIGGGAWERGRVEYRTASRTGRSSSSRESASPAQAQNPAQAQACASPSPSPSSGSSSRGPNDLDAPSDVRPVRRNRSGNRSGLRALPSRAGEGRKDGGRLKEGTVDIRGSGVGKGAREGSRERHLGVVAGRACEKGKPGGRVTVRASSAEGGGVVGVGGGRRGGGGGAGAGEGKGRAGQGRAGGVSEVVQRERR
ncbi:hypothetical protein AXG93_4193s1140 [Marchantia polymorpha subsp. ruderalis]|uniref:Uncharacterized protein n=1 Tax=Marchantia polymorpha subsp. ruderalis TaxID=1480154 RepID=A0A176W3V0_MARPO|nr:hypothetical protein AXG93_4193s1140 [Marchantia polymorpha subsp. ruderalis]